MRTGNMATQRTQHFAVDGCNPDYGKGEKHGDAACDNFQDETDFPEPLASKPQRRSENWEIRIASV